MHSMTALLASTVPEGRVFGIDFQTLAGICIQLLNAVILAAGLTFILYKPVKEFMRKRSDSIKGKMDEANAALERANQLIAEYERKLEEIDNEAVRIIETARQKAAEESNAILEKAKNEASELKRRSHESIAEEKRRLKEETRLYIIELASLIAQKYIAQSMDEQTQDRLFEEALAKLEYAPWQS